jgi:hypothetical protein
VLSVSTYLTRDLEQGTYELTVNISTDGDGASDWLDVGLFHEDLSCLQVSLRLHFQLPRVIAIPDPPYFPSSLSQLPQHPPHCTKRILTRIMQDSRDSEVNDATPFRLQQPYSLSPFPSQNIHRPQRAPSKDSPSHIASSLPPRSAVYIA